MDCPVESILVYWLKNLPAWGITLCAAVLAYKATMSWKQEFISKRQAEAAEKILSSLYAYVVELRRCRCQDEPYPHDPASTEIEEGKAGTALIDWGKKFAGFNMDCFRAAKNASIISRVHFSNRAHKLIEEIIAVRMIYLNAYKEGIKPGQSRAKQLECARILFPSKENDIAIKQAEQLLGELENLLLERS